MSIHDKARPQFTIACYPEKNVPYDSPDHPRHAFPEDWDSAEHPRFDFGRLQHCFENLLAKGYAVHADPSAIEIHSKAGSVVFQMKLPR